MSRPDRTERAQVVRNAASSYAVRAAFVVVALVLTPYLFRRLGPGGFGTWSVMLTLVSLFNLLETGVSAGVVRYVAAHRAAGDQVRLQRTIGTAAALLAGVGVVAAAGSAAIAFGLAGLAAEDERDAFVAGMLVLGAATLVRFPCVAYGAALGGFGRYDLHYQANAAVVVASAVTGVAAVEAGTGIVGLAVAHAGALVAGGFAYGVLLRTRVAPGMSLVPRIDAGARRELVGFSGYTLLADGMIYIGQRMDVLVIAALRNAVAAAPYAAVLKLQSGVQAVTLPFVDLLVPMAADLWARGSRAELARRLTLATRVAAQATIPLAAGLALFAEDAVSVWLGPAAPSSTQWIVVALMATQIIGLSAVPARKVLIGVGRVRLIGGLSAVEGIGNIALTVAFVAAFGAFGAALGTLIMVTAVAPLKLPLACRTLGFRTVDVVRQSLGVAIASSAPALAAMVTARLLLEPGMMRLIVGLGAGLGLAVVVASHQLGLRRALRRYGRRELGSPDLAAEGDN